MAGNKTMNPVMKMRKKQKEKEREKRREAKKHRKRDNPDEIDNSYNPSAIDQLKNKPNTEHYEENPISWQDLQMNMMTGNFRHASNAHSGYNQPVVGQNQFSGANYNGRNFNRPPQPTWSGDVLSSQPILYNQSGEALAPAQNGMNSEKPKGPQKLPQKPKMADEFDPLNPHKAKTNFKETFYGKDNPEEEQKDDATDKDARQQDVQKELEKIKGSPEITTTAKFRPAALRRKKKAKGKVDVEASITANEPDQNPVEDKLPDIGSSGLAESNVPSIVLPPLPMSHMNIGSSVVPQKIAAESTEIEKLVRKESNSDSDSDVSGPKETGGSRATEGLSSLMGRY